MDFTELEAFICLSETLHFAHTATIIHLSPSALSRLITRLEEDLCVSLFERDTRRVSLTKDGESFYEFAKDTIHRRNDLRLRINTRDKNLRGILRVYASVTACYSILPPFVEAINIEYPELRLSVETGDPADAANAVREERAELALSALPQEGYKDLDYFSVRKTPLVFISSSTGAYSKLGLSDNINSLEQVLSSIPLILPKTGLARDRFDKWIKIHSIKPHIAAETAGNEAILALGRLGLGLGLVPQLVLENGPFAEGLVQYNAGKDFGDYDIGFVQKQENNGTETARKQRKAIATVIRRTYIK